MSISGDNSWKHVLAQEGYTVVQCIDYGSFSDVFTIKQNDNNQKLLALKIIQSRHNIEEEECVVCEVESLVRLKHRHVIQLKDIVLTSNTACIIMEYASSGNLQQYVLNNGKLSHSSTLNLFCQLLSGLSFCHSKNIAHRDVNPSNILLMSPNFVKIGDFGLAFTCVDEDGSERLCEEYLGQASYLAPEVLMHCPFRPKPSDVWSLGCVLFLMCFGDKPFSGPAKTILDVQLEQGVRLPHRGEIAPALFVSSLWDMCCVDVNSRRSVNCVCQVWNNSNIQVGGEL